MKEQMRLTKETIEYLHILHVMHSTAKYYSDLFGIDPWEDPTQIPVDIWEKDGITILRLRFNSFPVPTDEDYKIIEIREIMQQYLDYCIFPKQTTLCPYMGGSTIYDIVEPLYIDRVEESKGMWKIDIVYVDNPLAFRYVKEKRWKGDFI